MIKKSEIKMKSKNTKKINITRRTKLGWAYSVTPARDGAYVPAPEQPEWFGTVRQLFEKIRNDRPFNNLGGGFYSTAWFAKVNDEWLPIKRDSFYYPSRLMDTDQDGKYLFNNIMVTVELKDN